MTYGCPTLSTEIGLISLSCLISLSSRLAHCPPHNHTKPASSSSTSPHRSVQGMFHLPTIRMSSPNPPPSLRSLFQRYVIAIITTLELSTIAASTRAGSELIQTHIQRIFTFPIVSLQPPRSQDISLCPHG